MGSPSAAEQPSDDQASRWASTSNVSGQEHQGPSTAQAKKAIQEYRAAKASASKPSFKKRAQEVFEDPSQNLLDRAVMYSMFFMIIISISAFILETMPALDSIPKDMWTIIEWICTAVFTLEYVIRFWACNADGVTSRIEWATKMMNICDVLATCPSYVEVCLSSNKQAVAVLRVARVFRLFKLGRHSAGFKVMTVTLSESVKPLSSLFFLFCIGIILFSSAVYYTERLSCPSFEDNAMGRKNFHDYVHECYDSGVSDSFGTCCAYKCDGMTPKLSNSLIGGLCRYSGDKSSERRLSVFGLGDLVPIEFPSENERSLQEADEDGAIDLLAEMKDVSVLAVHALGYKSIVEAFWWSCVTMTTVGYGEITPISWISRMVAAATMLSGIMLIALPVAIVGTKFHESYSELMPTDAKDEQSTPSADRPPEPVKKSKVPENIQNVKNVKKAISGMSKKPDPHIVKLRETLAESMEVKRQIMDIDYQTKTLWASAEQAMARLCYEGVLCKEELVDDPLAQESEEKYCKRSLFLFDHSSNIRRSCLRLMHWVWFDRFSLFLIVLNSVLLAIQNHREPDAPQNHVQLLLEKVFTILFTFESGVKIVAMGFCLEKSSYLRDAWNWLDFSVVLSGLVTLVVEAQQTGDSSSGGGGLTFLRTFRVLRPLRSLSALPGMRALVNTLILSIPKLANVFGMGLFLLVTFGILGVNFWGGVMHRRCRITNVPLRFTPRVYEGCSGVCLDGVSLVPVGSGFVNSSTAFEAFCRPDEDGCLRAWNKGEDFLVWPLDPDQKRFCGGRYTCRSPEETPSEWFGEDVSFAQVAKEVLAPLGVPILGAGNGMTVGKTYCGNALADDIHYGPASVHAGYEGEHMDLWEREVNEEDFNWGITHFDHLGCAFLVIFQSITLEGWVDIMYLLQDAHSDAFATIYFCMLIVVGSFFLLNITLAIVWDAFSSVDEERSKNEDRNGSKDIDGSPSATSSGPSVGRLSMLKLAHGKSLARISDYTVISVARNVAKSETFNNIIMFIIVMNVVTLGVDQYPPPGRTMTDVLDTTNTIFSIIFLIEFIVLIVAHGIYRYWTNPVLAFDGLIVLSSMAEMLMKGGSAVTALRGFRLLRIFKLAKKWESFRILLKSIVETVLQMGNFVLLLVLMIIVFTLMGQSFFALKFTFDEDGLYIPVAGDEEKQKELCPDWECVPRHHFDTFSWGFITIFQILSGENWNAVMYDGMKSTSWAFSMFFVFVVVIGNFVILNLFLAILMGNFEEQSKKLREEAALKKGVQSKPMLAVGNLLSSKSQKGAQEDDEEKVVSSPKKGSMLGKLQAVRGSIQSVGLFSSSQSSAGENSSSVVPTSDKAQTAPRVVAWEASNASNDHGGADRVRDFNQEGTEEKSQDARDFFEEYQRNWGSRLMDKSLFIFSRKGSVRQICTKIVVHPRFDSAILMFIITSSLLMAVSNPLNDPGSSQEQAVYWLNFFFTIIFTAELIVKVVAYGFIMGRGTYLRNPWNNLDILIVTICLLEFLPSTGGNLSVMKMLRILRALRPLRLISRNKNLKLVVNTLFKSVPELCNLLIVGSLFFLIFGLFGVSYLKGSFFRCADVELEDFSFNQTVPYTPLCVPESGGQVTAAWHLLEMPKENWHSGEGSACGDESQAWWRPTPKTPICQRRCTSDEDAPELCKSDEEWIGFRVMRCSDCASLMCEDEVVKERREGCAKECERHPFFCSDENDAVCTEQCIAQCACHKYCNGLTEHAALCGEQGGRWLNLDRNFDNVFNAILTLFEIATTEGWVDSMYAGVDGTGPMMQPVRDNVELMAWFFVGFILIGSFFVLNLCVGVIIDNFNKMKEDGQASGILVTDTQQSWVASQKAIMYKKQFFPLTHITNLPSWRVKLYVFVSSSRFENSIMACICLNTVVMAMQITPSPSKDYNSMLRAMNIFFAIVFNCEAFIKITAIQKNYFKENWNNFDFVCVVATDAGLLVDAFSDVPLGTVVSAIRLFRIARLFRLVRFMKGLNQLFSAFILSLPKLANVGTILALLLFLYAVLGVNLFAKVRFLGPHGETAHFKTFYRAFVTLARSMTGEAWNDLMHSLAKDKQYFGAYLDQVCLVSMDISTSEQWAIYEAKGQIEDPIECGTGMAFFYFVTYTLFVTFVILNLFIAVIFEGFDDSQKNIEGDIIQKCIEVWKRFDPTYTMFVSLDDAFRFINTVLEEIHGPPTKDGSSSKRGPKIASDDKKEESFDAYSVNLHYMKILNLHVSDNNTVHFVRAALAVLRYNVCKKDLKLVTTQSEKEEEKERLKELDELALDQSLKDYNLEERMDKALAKQCADQEEKKELAKEFLLIELIAATKIQRQFKELFQRKRNRQATKRLDDADRQTSKVMRAAG